MPDDATTASLGTTTSRRARGAAALCALALLTVAAQPASAWEPTAPVELVVPAGTGGGADQMARFIQKLITDNGMMRQPLTVTNKSGDSGVEGLMYLKQARGDPHKLIITLSNLFTSPLASGADFSWRDITPVQMLALDQFVLWVNANSSYRSGKELLDALRRDAPGSLKLGGTGSKQEDQLISVMLETAAATRIDYRPMKGGGDVARALAARDVDMTVNNPIEAEKLWRDGTLRPLCVFDEQPLTYSAKVAGNQSWADLPTCLSFGIPVRYLMMRSIFMGPAAKPEQVAYYQQLLGKVMARPEWKDFMARGAFKQTTMSGPGFVDWLDRTSQFHRTLMREAKFKAPMAALAATAPSSAASVPARR